MTKRMLWTSAAVAGVLTTGIATMLLRHGNSAAPAAGGARMRADILSSSPQLSDADILRSIQRANVTVSDLSVHNVGGIVVLKGTGDGTSAAQAGDVVRALGYLRVANMIRADAGFDDEGIRRNAERQLATNRSLDGCKLHISCDRGVLSVSGTYQNELQQDAVRSTLKTVRGAQRVHVEMSKL